jgi:AcrR family transcriptional regulator
LTRTRAEDYDDKRALIFERAAELFAESGFARASIADLATRCRASKSWIYHYFPSKEAILYGILRDHMEALQGEAARAIGGGDPPRAQLRKLLGAFMAIYARAQAKQAVLLNDLGCLPAAQQDEIRDLERQLVELVAGLLRRVNPALAMRRSLVKPSAMLLFGMLNWTHTWYRPDGALAPEQLAALAGDLFLSGLDTLAAGRRLAG